MLEQELTIQMPDGVSDALLYVPEDARKLPGVLFLTDIGGIRDSQKQIARRIAELGYTVFMPNAFYRTSRPPVMPPGIKFGDERMMKRVGELAAPLTPAAAEEDAGAYVNFMDQSKGISDAPIAAVGLCFSGALAMRIAAARPDRMGAIASFHGGRLYTDDPNSPHLLLPKIEAKLYFGHAEGDRSMAPEAIDKFEQALRDWGGRYESEVYEGAAHGWTVPDSPSYNPPQAERAFRKLQDLLAHNASQT